MLYFIAAIISLCLFFLNVSLLPHVWPILSIPTLFLPFIVIYSLKDRTIYPIILAFAMGILYDGSSIDTSVPAFTITFLAVVLAGRIIFASLTNYGVLRTSYTLTFLGVFMLWIFSYATVQSSLNNPIFYLHEGANLIVLLLFVLGLSVFGTKYFDSVEKTTSERYR